MFLEQLPAVWGSKQGVDGLVGQRLRELIEAGKLTPVIGRTNRCRIRAIGTLAMDADDGMTGRRRWSELSERKRRLLIAAAVAEGILKLAALIDIKRRPASQIRGPKWLWAAVVAVVSSAGVVPISYFAFGRRQPRSQSD
jgi:hypothetical protein